MAMTVGQPFVEKVTLLIIEKRTLQPSIRLSERPRFKPGPHCPSNLNATSKTTQHRCDWPVQLCTRLQNIKFAIGNIMTVRGHRELVIEVYGDQEGSQVPYSVTDHATGPLKERWELKLVSQQVFKREALKKLHSSLCKKLNTSEVASGRAGYHFKYRIVSKDQAVPIKDHAMFLTFPCAGPDPVLLQVILWTPPKGENCLKKNLKRAGSFLDDREESKRLFSNNFFLPGYPGTSSSAKQSEGNQNSSGASSSAELSNMEYTGFRRSNQPLPIVPIEEEPFNFNAVMTARGVIPLPFSRPTPRPAVDDFYSQMTARGVIPLFPPPLRVPPPLIYKIYFSSCHLTEPNIGEILQKKKEIEKVKVFGPWKRDQLSEDSLFEEILHLNDDVIDDRMKTSCDVTGKHMCKDCQEDEIVQPIEEARPKGRRSLSRFCPQVLEADSSKPNSGKFKSEIGSANKELEEPHLPNDVMEKKDTNPFLQAILRTVDEREDDFFTSNKDLNVPLVEEQPLTSISKEASRSSAVRKISFNASDVPPKSSAFSKKVQELQRPPYDRPRGIQKNQQYGNNSRERPFVPSAKEQMLFRRSLESATQLIFHRNQGLPLLYSAAAHRGHKFTFNNGSTVRSSLLPSESFDDEAEQELVTVPISPGAATACASFQKYSTLSPQPLLGTFEECMLHGRLEPVSTVHGFTAELGASGSFIPPHLHLPVTVFFYSLSDNDKISAPYLAHINLVKKGYNVPRKGTIQVTLFNPLKTVVKMFVVPYDFEDMPVNACTFLRQRTLYMPAGAPDDVFKDRVGCYKNSRYLIHLRFCSGKSGKIYLHTDIRMVISRKTDADTAIEVLRAGQSYEMRAQTYGPNYPKYSQKCEPITGF